MSRATIFEDIATQLERKLAVLLSRECWQHDSAICNFEFLFWAGLVVLVIGVAFLADRFYAKREPRSADRSLNKGTADVDRDYQKSDDM